MTLKGNTFPGRVAASLLNAIDLPDLITNSQEEYESLAIQLATNQKKLATVKERLKNNRLTSPLFNSELFTKNLAVAYLKIYERHQHDLDLDHVFI